MMYIFLALFLPLAYGFATLEGYPCDVFEDPVCTEPYDMLCPSPVYDYSGCPMGPGTCHESIQSCCSDNDGNSCPNYCPVMCNNTNNEVWCPDAPVNGCYGPGSCIAPVKNNFGGDCYVNCPLVCNDDYRDIYCPGSFDSVTGCEMPGYCASSLTADCPPVCDAQCDYSKGEIMCESGYDENGCNLGSHCIAPNVDKWNNTCYVSCPPVCNAAYGEVFCPGGIDYNGCEMPGHCAYSYSTDCPAVCDVQCDYYNKGEIMCENGYDENGCNLGSYCMAPTFDKWNNTCYATCPPVCNAAYGEIFCPGGFDSYSGCEMTGYCSYPHSTECAAVCYPRCDTSAGEIYCDNGFDDKGCSLGGYCATTCGALNSTAGSCFEEDTVYKGKALKDVNPIKDVESALDCQVHCQENPDCEYFTWNSGSGGGKWNKKNANTCWLKSTQGNINMHCGKKCTGRTSGAKFC